MQSEQGRKFVMATTKIAADPDRRAATDFHWISKANTFEPNDDASAEEGEGDAFSIHYDNVAQDLGEVLESLASKAATSPSLKTRLYLQSRLFRMLKSVVGRGWLCLVFGDKLFQHPAPGDSLSSSVDIRRRSQEGQTRAAG